MKFSLVLPTIHRTEELKRFLFHLEKQTYRNFELIIVDQNNDNRLEPILSAYKDFFPIIHLRSEKGLSRARNVGLKKISGDIVAFPDDDCWYPADLLERVCVFLKKHPDIAGYTGKSVDENNCPSINRWSRNSGKYKPNQVWTRATSFTIFLRKFVIDQIGDFDESLGVGSGTPWGSAEEVDYLIRVLHNGLTLYYDPGVTIYHPQPVLGYDKKSIERASSYGGGMGRVLRKHRFSTAYSFYHILVRPFGGMMIALLLFNYNKYLYHWVVLKSRMKGWLSL